MRRVLMIAGPNGAGKTTFARALLPDLLKLYQFVNADEIARGLSPLDPESMALTASKLMIKSIRELLLEGKSFAFETTAAGTNYVKHLKEARSRGFEVNLLYIFLATPEMAVQRVAERVTQGGHSVPPETIRRRYFTGLKNLFKYYLPLADTILILDNSIDSKQSIVARKNIGACLEILDMQNWDKICGVVSDA